ncbi:hypothetical protein CR513_19380, partial [Mucuna pruriens]
MATYTYDDKILIHYFQDSLMGYKYNEDMVLDYSWLQNMVKKEQEGFKEYAQRWQELVAQVQPPITERKMVTIFINTLPSPYYNKVVGSVTSNFADLVVVGERIELGIRSGKFAHVSRNVGFAKKLTSKKKKGEANAVERSCSPYPAQSHIGVGLTTSSPPTPYVPPYQPQADTGVAITLRPAQQGARRPPRMLTLIPMTYTELLPQLLEQKLVEIVPLKPLVPPYPRSYNPNAKCDYHGRVVSHATKRCWSLKHKVQDLLDGGLLGFQDQGPNVQSNPLPAYRGATVNAISHENEERAKSPNRQGRSLVAWPSW